MSDLSILTSQRDDLLNKIREIEASCEGIENENNARRVQQLNLEHAQYTAQKKEISARLSAVEAKLSSINTEILKLSGTGVDQILNSISRQRYYFFKNKPKVLFDRDTGLLWANLHMFPWGKDNNTNYYTCNDALSAINSYSFEIDGFRIPDAYELWEFAVDTNNPYHSGQKWRLMEIDYWICSLNGCLGRKDLDDSGATNDFSSGSGGRLFPCSDHLVHGTDYKTSVASTNPVYTKKEQHQFTLDLWVQHDLWPIFNNAEISELYKKIYFDKPRLLEQLQELQSQIKELQTVTLLSSDFDYTVFLAKYDIKAIDDSVIKYYKAVQQWCNELMEKLNYYENKKASVIKEFNLAGAQLEKQYEMDCSLTGEENTLLRDRQKFFRQKFSLGMAGVRSKLLAVKKQADDLEWRIDQIDEGMNPIFELAELEQEKRASFSFLTENTAKIVKNALLKIEFYERNRDFVISMLESWDRWNTDYRKLTTSYRSEMENDCEANGISPDVWVGWYQEWRQLRYDIELKMQPVLEYDLNRNISTNSDGSIPVSEQLISLLNEYKQMIDSFFKNERREIYQRFTGQYGWEIQDRFETEKALFNYTMMFLTGIGEVISDCTNVEDKLWILNWTDGLLDKQIDSVLDFIDQKNLANVIDPERLNSFAGLKQIDSEIYLSGMEYFKAEKDKYENDFHTLLIEICNDSMRN